MIDGPKLIIQDTAEGHYPQLVINPHEIAGTELVITIIMKTKKKVHDIFLLRLSLSFSKELIFHPSPNQVAWIISQHSTQFILLILFLLSFPEVVHTDS